MFEEQKKRVKLYRRLLRKYRLVIMNDETLEEKFSFLLSPINVFTWGGALSILLIAATTILIAFTPLREYIPGYSDPAVRRLVALAALKADSIDAQLYQKDRYLQNFKAVIEGNPHDYGAFQGSGDTSAGRLGIHLQRSKEDSLLRQQVESEEKYNLLYVGNQPAARDMSGFFFFTPLNGLVSASYNSKEEHYGVDVIAQKNDAVKAILDGTVILSTWTSDTGHIIEIQHENNLISVYKHNSTLLKKTGDQVRAGEAIAIVGESGELTSGPHLHFELWHNGKPVDPQDYMIF